MKRPCTWIVVLATALAPTTAVAQAGQQHPHGQMQRGMMGPGTNMMPGPLAAFAPGALLGKRDTLGLSADQVHRLERIQADGKTRHDEAMASHDQHRQQMMAALQAPLPDPDAVHAHFQGAHEAMGAAHWAELDAALAAMAVLTEEQRATVRSGIPAGGDMRKP
jgi:Spy/CpxP family protein refolding chaperone